MMSYCKAAVNSHKTGDIENALKNYKLAYEAGEKHPYLFQNFGALLRTKGDHANSGKYKRGLKFHPDNTSILRILVILSRCKTHQGHSVLCENSIFEIKG